MEPTRPHLVEIAHALAAPSTVPTVFSMELPRYVLPALSTMDSPMAHAWPARKDITLLEAPLHVLAVELDVLRAHSKMLLTLRLTPPVILV